VVDEEFSVTASMSTLGVLTLQVVGELDAATEDRLTDELTPWPRIHELIIDLQECTFIDSRGLRALLECQHRIGSRASMRLIGVPSDAARTIRLAGLETLLGLDSPT
jgi:anti-anti-sigma factor